MTKQRAHMSVEDRIYESRIDRCKHLNAILHNETCKAGVNYHALANVGELGKTGWILRLPCNRNRPRKPGEAVFPCDKAEYYTEDEARKYAKIRAEEEAESMRKIHLVRDAILEEIKRTGKNRGYFGCPACLQGMVGYSRASNGHVHASCSSDGCVSWME